METAYGQAEWKWEEFYGPYDKAEQSRIVDIPYQRYQRSFVEPPSIELTVATAPRVNRVVPLPRLRVIMDACTRYVELRSR